MVNINSIKATTIIGIRKNNQVVIAGDGYISCYSPLDRFFVKVRSGLAAYVVEEDVTEEKTLIYTIGGNLVEIETRELIEIGFD